VFVSHKIFCREDVLRPSPAALGGNCPSASAPRLVTPLKTCRRPWVVPLPFNRWHLSCNGCPHWRSQGGWGRGHALPRNWVHKKIPGCAVELNTQNCAWFRSQISLITATSFREAMPTPRTTHQGLCPWTPLGDFRSPRPSVSPRASKSWLSHWLSGG